MITQGQSQLYGLGRWFPFKCIVLRRLILVYWLLQWRWCWRFDLWGQWEGSFALGSMAKGGFPIPSQSDWPRAKNIVKQVFQRKYNQARGIWNLVLSIIKRLACLFFATRLPEAPAPQRSRNKRGRCPKRDPDQVAFCSIRSSTSWYCEYIKTCLYCLYQPSFVGILVFPA